MDSAELFQERTRFGLKVLQIQAKVADLEEKYSITTEYFKSAEFRLARGNQF
jgi:hypothetical protein